MKSYKLKDFFNIINYNWEKDKEQIKTICHYTKTRVNSNIIKPDLTFGTEQTFLIKSIAEWMGAESFFEIGTGRGTACYAVSLIPKIKTIHTVDILEFHQKFYTAIGHQLAYVSLSDIKKLIPFDERDKINFHHRREFPSLQKKFKKQFDLAFIDGNHTDKNIILEDYALCKEIIKDDGIILWDDWDPDQFAVKNIVEQLLKGDSKLNAILIEQRGHLFDDKPAEINKGVVLMRKGKKII